YRLTGKVVFGDRLGTSLGYPTANLELAFKDKLIPKAGVYAVKVSYNQSAHDGMMYIGKRPTIVEDGAQALEVHLLDFAESMYGKEVTVEFIEFLRDDIKFENKEDLVAQIGKDEKATRQVLS